MGGGGGAIIPIKDCKYEGEHPKIKTRREREGERARERERKKTKQTESMAEDAEQST